MGFKPPKNLNFEGNLNATPTRIWFYWLAARVTEKDERIKVDTLLHVAEPQAQQIFNLFEFENWRQVQNTIC